MSDAHIVINKKIDIYTYWEDSLNIYYLYITSQDGLKQTNQVQSAEC